MVDVETLVRALVGERIGDARAHGIERLIRGFGLRVVGNGTPR
jgi:hypothetical protein